MRWPIALAAGLLLAPSGCSGSGGFVEATGRLTYKGKPVPSTYVIFAPDDGRRASHGLTDDNGHFTLTNNKTESGVYVGKHTVVLRYHASGPENLHELPPKASPELKKVIAKYGDQTKSPLHYEIAKNGQFVEIALD